MLKHTATIKDDKLRIGILKLLTDGKIKQEQAKDVLELLKKVPNRIIQEAFFAGLFEFDALQELGEAPADYDLVKDLDQFVRWFQLEKGATPIVKGIKGNDVTIPKYKIIPMELKKEILVKTITARDVAAAFDEKYEEKWGKEVPEKVAAYWISALVVWEFVSATNHIQDLDLRIKVLDFMFDYKHLVKYIIDNNRERTEGKQDKDEEMQQQI